MIIIDCCLQERNLFYVVQVEVFLAKVFSSFNTAEDDEDTMSVDSPLFSHVLDQRKQRIRGYRAATFLWRNV